jgi:RHS repeat-associated protein
VTAGRSLKTENRGSQTREVRSHCVFKLPFGEELFAGVGGRTIAQGYSASDEIRQHFISKERDTETGLDYFGARYFSSTQGRFMGVDPVGATKYHLLDPQLWNAYSYGLSNPLTIIDVDGRFPWTIFIRSFIFRSMVGAFGYGYRGDARGPSTDEGATARIRMQFTLDIDRSQAHLSITGQITGDKFPSTEAFIVDQSGNRVFLGAKYEEGDSLASKGRNLAGDKANLFKVDMKVRFDKKATSRQ